MLTFHSKFELFFSQHFLSPLWLRVSEFSCKWHTDGWTLHSDRGRAISEPTSLVYQRSMAPKKVNSPRSPVERAIKTRTYHDLLQRLFLYEKKEFLLFGLNQIHSTVNCTVLYIDAINLRVKCNIKSITRQMIPCVKHFIITYVQYRLVSTLCIPTNFHTIVGK